MSIISYAQNFEDVMLWRALGHIKQGFYIDIGAQDPIIDSVSLAFHEKGWKGIHVEPTPHYAELLRQKRPGDTVIQAAVGEGPSVLQFFEISETGISTADPVIADQHRERGFHIKEITVPCISLSDVFEICSNQDIHWLKIDVEGLEKQVVSSWGKSVARPWILVIEGTLPLTQVQTHESWEQLVISYEYTPIYFDGLNRYYVSNSHPELKNAFAYPPNVFDEFVFNGTASATFGHLIQKRYQEKIEGISCQMAEQQKSAEREIDLLSQSMAASEKTHIQAKLEMEELLRNKSLREQELAQQLQAGQQEFQRQLNDRFQREKVLSEQTGDAVQALERLLRDQARREQEVSAYVLNISERAAQQKIDQACQQREEERTLQQHYFDSEKKYLQRINESQEECERLLHQKLIREEQVSALLLSQQHELRCLEREKLHVESVSKNHEARLELLLVQSELEQKFNVQLQSSLELEQRRNEELSRIQEELGKSFDKSQEVREDLLRTQSKLEQQFNEQLRARSELERQLNEQLSSSSALEQKRNEELVHLQRDIELLELRLKQERSSGQQMIAELNGYLAELQGSLTLMRGSFSWKITAPLRKLSSAFGLAPLNIANNKALVTPVLKTLNIETSVSINEQEKNKPVHLIHAEEIHISRKFEGDSSMSVLKNIENSKIVSAQTISQSKKMLTTDELLEFHDRDFICNVYQVLLLREPDADGLNYYLTRLRKGVSKMEIVSQIFDSFERKSTNRTIPQLEEYLHRFKLSRFPIFGRIYTYITGHEGFCSKDAKLRQIENQLYRHTEQLNNRLNDIDHTLILHKTVLHDLSEKYGAHKDISGHSSKVNRSEPDAAANIVPSIHVAEIFSELGKSIIYKSF